MHAMVLAASMAKVCNLTLKLSSEDRTGRICKGLGCDTAELVPNAKTFDADYRVQYLPKIGVRCQVHPRYAHNEAPCVFEEPGCLTRLNEVEKRRRRTSSSFEERGLGGGDPVRSEAMKALFSKFTKPRLTPTCSDGKPPSADTFDVTVHFRAINDAYERRSSVANVVFDAEPAKNLGPPLADVVDPLADYLDAKGLRREIFLAANLPGMRDVLLDRFRDRGVRACALAVNASFYKHANNDCDACDDVTFSEWIHLAKATTLLAQIGLHCDGDCLDPTKRKYGWRSSFSYTAATYANVPTLFLDGSDTRKKTTTGRPLDDDDLSPAAACHAENTATIGLTAAKRWTTPAWN